MCGIAGFVQLDGAPADRRLLDTMIREIGHRGPDDRGIHVARSTGLAHARLSIIDVAGGHQPLANEDESVWIVFNGEIFNYVELRADLESRGHRFRTRSDTEVIVHLYEEYGDDCVRQLNGQWAFAIWDDRRRRLFLSRDRLGVRPLFYTTSGHRFAFASEIKALFTLPGVPRTIDPKGIDQTFTFWHPLAPRTVFEGVSELPPAHSLAVEHDGVGSPRRYWSLDFREGDPVANEDAAAAELVALLEDATRIRLRSDVPVGVYLSGGLDSSLIGALVCRVGAERPRTFSIAFDDPEFDESAYQREVSEFLGTSHTSFTCSYSDIARSFPDVVWHAERPILRTAPAPLFLLSKAVREARYKVVLTGEGSDEVFGGYDIYREAKIRRFVAAQPHSAWRPLLFKRLYPYLPGIQAQSPAYLQAFFQARPDALADPCFSHLPRWELTARVKAFFSDELRDALRGYDAIDDLRTSLPESFMTLSWLGRAQYLETTGLLPGYILSAQGDRVGMANAVEGRFPFLDHRVVEFAARLPARLKLKVLREKYLLKRAAESLVPPSVVARPKQPYRAPDARSFFGGATRDYVHEALSSGNVAEARLFKPAVVDALVKKAQAGRVVGARDNMALVGVLSAQLLVGRFVNRVRMVA